MRINPFQAVYPNFDYVASTDTFFNTVKTAMPYIRAKICYTEFHHNSLMFVKVVEVVKR